jgi:uncharacterized protein with PIN domain
MTARMTTAEEVGMTGKEAAELEVNCPKCSHPMMSGPLQPKRGSGDYRTADWYCANCHHVVWAGEAKR